MNITFLANFLFNFQRTKILERSNFIFNELKFLFKIFKFIFRVVMFFF